MKELQFSCPNSPQRRLLVLTLFGGKESEVRREPFAASRDAGGGKVVGGEPLLSKKRMFCLHSIQKRKKLKTHSEVLFSFLRETKPHFKLLHLYGAGFCSLAIDNFHSIISSCCHEPGYQGLSPARWKPPQGRTKQGQPGPLVKSTDSLIHHV